MFLTGRREITIAYETDDRDVDDKHYTNCTRCMKRPCTRPQTAQQEGVFSNVVDASDVKLSSN
jgi:hypothetical protein